MEEFLNNQLQTQNQQFQELLHRKMVDHEKEIEDQNLKHLKSLHEEQTQSYKREEKLKHELDFIKNSFHSYKVEFLHYFISSCKIEIFHRSILIKIMLKNFRLKSIKYQKK